MNNPSDRSNTDQLPSISTGELHNGSAVSAGTSELILEDSTPETDKLNKTKPLGMIFDDEPLPFPETMADETDSVNHSPIREPIIQFAKRCQIGRRPRHEDACVAMTVQTGGHFATMPFGLFVVADGMGGHKNGHIASKTASHVVASYIMENIYLPMLKENGTPPPIQSVMLDAVAAAHRALYDPDPEKDSGTTLSTALIFGKRLFISHVGDSRVYLHSDGNLTQLTTDHSLARRLQDVGTIAEDDEEAIAPISNILLRAVGQGEELEIDAYTRSLPAKGGKLILCTDGLWGSISKQTFADIMNRDVSLQECCDMLYSAAFEAGSTDNITVLIVEFSF